ncbi:hypothetical protein B0A48_00188 [Cryoendolithus antarcticus]|uniref:Homeobox domain-containing protein n=1 Tax=Cryoendolithus antarcticus TaxID=1507870 RepID=A0A1V8TTW5_9PEZI|nr:hypothetical protein B0A48_00188 [Cryoendolithus antarcticus]
MADVMLPPERYQSEDLLSDSPIEDDKPSMLPPSSHGSSASSAAAAARRPPRKSTLTQQQKNQKRQRATQDQLMTLEIEFNKNPTPTALVRERIASDINMTERSVQIWFQNRRAKIKNIAKRSIESGEDCDSIPDSMRQYLAMQAYGPSKGMMGSMMGRVGPGFSPYGPGLVLNTDPGAGKTVIQHFQCRSLSIGTWRRVGQSSMDLVIFYSPEKGCVTYYINNDSAGYKIEYPFAWIKNITLDQGDVQAAAEGASQRTGGLVVELTRPPKFYMDSSGSGGFYECGDFTEEQQASQVMVHHLGGPSKTLSGQLAKLVSLEAYQNRHAVFDHNLFGIASAPVSPIVHRPASQPNHLVHPHNPMNLFPHDPNMGLMGPPAPRGHKRQRSRSVPAAIDFSMIRQPMPSFMIQHEGHAAPLHMQDPAIFAPQPQYQHAQNFAPTGSLSIDTSANYGMDFRFAGPMSATTLNSPSDFGTPAFFASAPSSEPMHPVQFSTPHNNSYLAVDPGAMIGTSNTPLSMGYGDPAIADHSPPLSGMGRSQSADLFGTPGDNSQLNDEGTYLSDSFNKQMALPFRSPMNDEFHSPMPDGSFTFEMPPPSTSHSDLNIPYRIADGTGDYQSPPHQPQDGSMSFPSHTPGQQHQDSGVSFDTPSQMPREQAMHFQSPKNGGLLYQDSNVFQSPSPMHHVPEGQQSYHPSPQKHDSPTQEQIDMQNMGMFIDPNSISQH